METMTTIARLANATQCLTAATTRTKAPILPGKVAFRVAEKRRKALNVIGLHAKMSRSKK
jgi:hypothetical protein